MRSRIVASIGFLLGLSACALPEPADLILRRGNIYTLSRDEPRVTALAARGETIVYLGSDRGARAYEGSGTRVVDLHGATAVPGFRSSGIDLVALGRDAEALDLGSAESVTDLLEQVGERASRTPPGEWVLGREWSEAAWIPPKVPTRFDLDTVSPRNPVWLERTGGKLGVANSLALERAGIDLRAPADPIPGIVCDRETGEPNGIVLAEALARIRQSGPEEIASLRRELFRQGALIAVRRGWTAVTVPDDVAVGETDTGLRISVVPSEALPKGTSDDPVKAYFEVVTQTAATTPTEALRQLGAVLEVGRPCDVTVLSRDITRVSPPQILGARILWTVIGGEVVYRRDP